MSLFTKKHDGLDAELTSIKHQTKNLIEYCDSVPHPEHIKKKLESQIDLLIRRSDSLERKIKQSRLDSERQYNQALESVRLCW